MFFLNLSLPEFLALFGSLSGVVVALYLLDRLRKKYTVSTLRFFVAADRPPRMKHRRRLQQPWSLILQLVSLALLLLAIAQLRFGLPDRSSRDHILILDSSAWMAARSGTGRLIDQSRAAAQTWLRRLPSADRVMVIRADALATPATVFETDRHKIEQAIAEVQPGASSLNLAQALEFAAEAQRLHAQRPGEIVFAGAGRVSADDPAPGPLANLRILSAAGPAEHCGLRKMGVRRSLTDPDIWEIFVAVKNYGSARRSAPLVLRFGGAPAGSKRFDLAPGAEESASFEYRTRAAGWLEARLLSPDGFSLDARAVLELPARNLLAVAIYSAEPSLLRPVFNAIPGVHATFLAPAQYDSSIKRGLVLLDRFTPPSPPAVDSIWIQPPAARSPIFVKTVANVKLNRWRSSTPIAAGLYAKDLAISGAEVLRPSDGDIVVADSNSGPLIVARPAQPKIVVFGFHPVRSAMKYELTTPLLFANLLRWMEPDTFRSWESVAGGVGSVNVELEAPADPAAIRVIRDDGGSLPFTVEGKTLRFFSAAPGVVRVLTGAREYVYSLTLPQPGDTVWTPSSARHGFPPRAPAGPGSRDLWPWLALFGGAGLIAEWLLFGRMRKRSAPGAQPLRRAPWRKAS